MSEIIQLDEILVGAILRNVAPARLYEEALRPECAGQLAELFKANFAAFVDETSTAIKQAGPA